MTFLASEIILSLFLTPVLFASIKSLSMTLCCAVSFTRTHLLCGSSLEQPCASRPALPDEDNRKVSLRQLRRFSWRELQLATDNLSESNIIGLGGFGKVYKGFLSDNTKVDLKSLTVTVVLVERLQSLERSSAYNCCYS